MFARMRTADDAGVCLADIDEESLKDFERRLAMAGPMPSGQRNRHRPDAPQLVPSGESGVSARHADFLAATAPSPAMRHAAAADSHEDGAPDLLAELAQEVAARKQAGIPAPDRHAKARQLDRALSRIFDFFNQMARHANLLEPEISRSYRLDAQTTYTGLRWHGAFADYRKQDLSENAHLAHVSFRLRLHASRPVTVVRRWDQVAMLKRDLHILDLRTINESILAPKPEQEFMTLELAADFPVQIRFQGNYDAHRIDVLCRNLEGFCVSTFVLDVGQVSQSLLDELGRFLLSRSTALPGALRRVFNVHSTDQVQ